MTIDLQKYRISSDWQKFEDFRLRKKTGLLTGFAQIDRSIVSLPGLTCVIGDTGYGKSMFTLNVAVNNARTGVPVIYVDKEVGLHQTRVRLLCIMGGLTPGAIESGKFYGDEEKHYKMAQRELSSLPIYYFDDVKQTDLEEVFKAVCKFHKRRVLLIVDSLNRLISNFNDRRGDVDSWATLFNNLKLKYDNYLNIWMICEKSKQEYGKASGTGVKESSTLEYLSELLIDLYPTKDKSGVIVECLKNRQGPKGIITQLYATDPFMYRLEEADYIPEAQ